MAGCPTIELDLDNVKYLLTLEYKLEDIATILNVSSSTNHMKNAHIEKYPNISFRDLDETVRGINSNHPNDGEVLMLAI